MHHPKHYGMPDVKVVAVTCVPAADLSASAAIITFYSKVRHGLYGMRAKVVRPQRPEPLQEQCRIEAGRSSPCPRKPTRLFSTMDATTNSLAAARSRKSNGRSPALPPTCPPASWLPTAPASATASATATTARRDHPDLVILKVIFSKK